MDRISLTRRDLARTAVMAAAANTLLALPAAGVLAQTPAATPGTIDPMSLVDPDLRPPLEAMLGQMAPPSNLTVDQIPALRQAFESQGGPPRLPQPSVEERTIPGPTGAPDVRVYVVNPSPGSRKPAILHIHGGGFIFGSAAEFVPALQAQAQALDGVIVSVDYRLAPETPFPGSLEDNYAGLLWLHDHADELGADPDRIALQGESAGGGHAAMLAIAARDRGGPPVVFQSLVYPMLDDRTGSTRTLPDYIGAFVWTPDFNRLGWTALLGVPAGSDNVPAGAVPARVVDLAGLPPAWIGVGSIDLFAEEDIAYAGRLILAGVPTGLLVVPGAYHGFDAFVPDAPVSLQFRLAQYDALARAFGEPAITSLAP
ncbi:MAG TPA: alpha/beta hydrolase, partial [Thermomicrobiales bacterium]|nr:alpha/beta hydrolase [Thermomicrobiales bacterium]